MKIKAFAILTTTLFLAGCTLPSTSPTESNPVDSAITGNWEITLNSTAYGVPYPFGIYLTQTGSTVSGIGSWAGEAFPTDCPASGPCAGYPFVMLSPTLSGTIGAGGSIVLTSTASSSNAAVLSITASTTSSTTSAGSFTLATPTTAIDHGPVAAVMIAPLNGTYAGTLVSSVTGNSITVTTTLNQTGPATSGFLDFSGSADLTGVSCIGSVAMPVSGNFLGSQLSINLLPANLPGSGIYLNGTISPDAKTIAVNYESVSSGCADDFASGTLTLQ